MTGFCPTSAISGAELDAATLAAVLERTTGAELALSDAGATGAELELS